MTARCLLHGEACEDGREEEIGRTDDSKVRERESGTKMLPLERE